MEKSIRILISLLVIMQFAAANAQQVYLQGVQRQVTASGEKYIFYSNKSAEYSTTFSEEPPAILLYLHNTLLPVPADSIVKQAWENNVVLERWMDSPPVIKASIVLPEKMNYRVLRNASSITLVTYPETEENKQDLVLPDDPQKTRSDLLKSLGHGAKISVDFRDADIGNVLRLFARQNNLNIVASDSVQGKITVALHQVTLEQALESILLANGYKYIVLNDIILVKPEDEINEDAMVTRAFKLRYIDANNLHRAVEEMVSPLGKVKVLTTNFHNREDVYAVNERVQPDREMRYWMRSSVLVVRDYPAQLKMIAELIAKVDVPVPQVLIEAKLVEITPEHETNIGIDWTRYLGLNLYGDYQTSGGGVKTYSGRTNLPNTDGRITFGTLTTSEFSTVLNFLNTNANTKLVSNPRILAMDNEPADISVGTNFPIPQITRGVGGQGDVVTFNYRDINIKLRVTPHVTTDNNISMYVNPIIEEVTGEVTVDQNTAPITQRREVDTVVKVRNGETIVIGGMIKEREVTTQNKVWLLGSVPLLGHLFQNKSSQKVQTDLVIFITPQIMD